MQVERHSDIRLIGRAMKEGWPVDRAKVAKALQETVDNRDPDLMLGAAALLLKADEINVKREAIQQRELKDNEDRRLQLLELAQRIPARDLARIASEHGDGSSGDSIEGRATEPARADGEEAGSGT